MSVAGIDLSDYQTLSRQGWTSLVDQGLKFVFIKATEGRTFKAETFQAKWQQAKEVGMIRGAYHFFRPSKTSEEQASNFLESLAAVGGLESGDLAPVLDIETRDGVDGAEIRRRCHGWLRKVEAETGRRPIIYAGSSFGGSVLGPDQSFASYPLWVAHYIKSQPSIPPKWPTCAIWQYTDKGRVRGINGNVDLNWFNGDLDGLKAFAAGDASQVLSNALFADLIHSGDEGSSVASLQKSLLAKGYDLGTFGPDGDFGSFTETAVMRFQKDVGLPINGVVDLLTQEKLSLVA